MMPMKLWNFRTYNKASGRDAFEDWLQDQTALGEEGIRTLLRRMSNTETWIRPYFGNLHGKKYNKIKEIILKSDKQYRVLGCFGPGPQTFTILIGSTKESQHGKTIWNPHDAPDTAEKRRKLVFEDKEAYSHEYKPR
jgi:hypothetical protein